AAPCRRDARTCERHEGRHGQDIAASASGGIRGARETGRGEVNGHAAPSKSGHLIRGTNPFRTGYLQVGGAHADGEGLSTASPTVLGTRKSGEGFVRETSNDGTRRRVQQGGGHLR